jgi:Kef-type K+ transport system membrane component KefB/uncharacterized protein with GYD domain
VDVHPANLLVVFAAAALAPILVDLPRRVRVPVILAEIALGIIVGPHLLHLARVDDLVDSLAELGLATLFFLAGLEIDVAELRGRPGVLAVRGWTLSLALGLAAAAVLWGTKLIGAPVLVGLALTTTSLGALVPILGDAGLAGGALGRHAIAVGAAGELGPIVGLSIILALASGEPWRTGLLILFAAVVIGVAHIGTRLRPPRILRLVEATMHSSGQMAVRLSILLLAGLFVLADELGLDVILGAFLAGMVVAVVTRGVASREFRTKLDGIGYGFLVPVFFVTTGLRFDADGLISDAANVVLVPGFALLFLLARGLPVWPLPRGAARVGAWLARPPVGVHPPARRRDHPDRGGARPPRRGGRRRSRGRRDAVAPGLPARGARPRAPAEPRRGSAQRDDRQVGDRDPGLDRVPALGVELQAPRPRLTGSKRPEVPQALGRHAAVAARAPDAHGGLRLARARGDEVEVDRLPRPPAGERDPHVAARIEAAAARRGGREDVGREVGHGGDVAGGLVGRARVDEEHLLAVRDRGRRQAGGGEGALGVGPPGTAQPFEPRLVGREGQGSVGLEAGARHADRVAQAPLLGRRVVARPVQGYSRRRRGGRGEGEPQDRGYEDDPDRHLFSTLAVRRSGRAGRAPMRYNGTMPTYIMLSTLSPEGVQTIKNNPQRIKEVNHELEQLGAEVKAQWATLGQFDFVNVVEAPDEKTMARVSLELGSRGTAKFETLSAIPIDDFISSI